jgi:hypothetical protein
MNSRRKENPFNSVNLQPRTEYDFELTKTTNSVFQDNISLILDGALIQNKKYSEYIPILFSFESLEKTLDNAYKLIQANSEINYRCLENKIPINLRNTLLNKQLLKK